MATMVVYPLYMWHRHYSYYYNIWTMVYTVYSTNIPPSVSVIGVLTKINGNLPLTSTSGGTYME